MLNKKDLFSIPTLLLLTGVFLFVGMPIDNMGNQIEEVYCQIELALPNGVGRVSFRPSERDCTPDALVETFDAVAKCFEKYGYIVSVGGLEAKGTITNIRPLGASLKSVGESTSG